MDRRRFFRRLVIGMIAVIASPKILENIRGTKFFARKDFIKQYPLTPEEAFNPNYQKMVNISEKDFRAMVEYLRNNYYNDDFRIYPENRLLN